MLMPLVPMKKHRAQTTVFCFVVSPICSQAAFKPWLHSAIHHTPLCTFLRHTGKQIYSFDSNTALMACERTNKQPVNLQAA